MMQSFFDAAHWNRVKQARAERGLNRIPVEATLRPQHRMANATLLERETGELWNVVRLQEDWQQGSYLLATLSRGDAETRTCVVETISCDTPEILSQLLQFHTEFEILFH
ncbi:TPA: hypothetical protein QDB04_000176 [Burkholderia vietnamiensis]|nr:hypothetical protein [Burkholderia vietnamiensis]